MLRVGTMSSFPIHEAKARLSKLIERALAGETIVISRGKTPMVRLVPVERAKGRCFGAMRGRALVSEAFFESLPEEELGAW